MDANQLALVQGMEHTRATLREWNREPWKVLRAWLVASLLIALALLFAVWAVAESVTTDTTRLRVPGVTGDPALGDVAFLFGRNLLVLALHSMACVAGFMAGSSLPTIAEHQTGISKWVHEKAGPLAIGFVALATLFSLTTQAYALGDAASTIACHLSTPAAISSIAKSISRIEFLATIPNSISTPMKTGIDSG